MDDLSFTRVWNVNLFCLIPFVPDKFVLNVNTRCLLPWHITEGSSNASSSLTEEDTSGSHYWKLFRLWSDVRKLRPTTINYYAHNTISQVTDQGQRRGVRQKNLTSGWHGVCVQDSIFFLCTIFFLSAITCQCHCPEITECWKLSAIWWWPRADREPSDTRPERRAQPIGVTRSPQPERAALTWPLVPAVMGRN